MIVPVIVTSVLIFALGSEFYFSRRYGITVYRLKDTFSHVALMLGQQAMNVFSLALMSVIYLFLFDRYRLTTLSTKNPWAWMATILLTDLAFYIGHRLGHRVNLFITYHSVHHQALDFNHISSARQSWLTRPMMFPFYLPLAFIGVVPELLLGATLVNLAVQFFSHNGVIRRHLGVLEYLFVTPRSHRVHHGTNAPYLDRNFGGAFIVWDRLFGTYQDAIDDIPVRIGWGKAQLKFAPIAAQVSYPRKLAIGLRKENGIAAKARLLFGAPELLMQKLTPEEKSLGTFSKIPSCESSEPLWRVVAWFFVLVISVGFLAKTFSVLGMGEKAAMALLLFGLNLGLGRSLDRYQSGSEKKFVSPSGGRERLPAVH